MKPSVLVLSLFALNAALVSGQSSVKSPQPVGGSDAALQQSGVASRTLSANYGKLPLSFEANQGQSDPRVRFTSRGNGYSLFLTDSGALLQLSQATRSVPVHKKPGAPSAAQDHVAEPAKTDAVGMELVGASHNTHVEGTDRLPGVANYFIGNDSSKWRTNVPTYSRVKYSGVYPGIDLVYYGNQRQLEYDFVVAPEVDPKPVALRFAGAKKLKLSDDGSLRVIARNGEVVFHKPVVYQVKDGIREAVDGRFKLAGRHKVGFALGQYDRSRELVIDPILQYSTYLGGSNSDYAYGVAVDSAGNAYVTGGTYSSDFPTTSGAYQTTNHALSNTDNALVTKLNSAGTALIYSTYLGGSNYTYAYGLAVDASGDAYLGGTTYASDLPTTTGAFQTVNHGLGDKTTNTWVAKLNPTGSALLYSTYLGGSGNSSGGGDFLSSLAIDSAGDAFVTGFCNSADFPTTAGAFQTTNKAAAKSSNNAFVTKLNPTGTALVYSTYLGGSTYDYSASIALDGAGNAYVTGLTLSTDFPITSGAFQSTINTVTPTYAESVFVTKMNSSGSALVYSTFLGGTGATSASAIAVDTSGDGFIAGYTYAADFPVTSGAFQTTNSASGRAFISKMNPAGSALLYSTFLGGSGAYYGGDYADGIAIDTSGNAYITGDTYSTDFPLTPDAFQTTNNGATPVLQDDNAFVTELNSSGTALLYSTYLGGSSLSYDYGQAIALDGSGGVYVVGPSSSSNFPVTGGAFQTTNKTYQNTTGFVAKFLLNPNSGLVDTNIALSSNGNPQNQGASVTFTAVVTSLSGSGIPTGNVAFSVSAGAPVIVALDGTGHASYSTSSLPVGPQALIATYAGNSTYASSNAAFTQTILGPPANLNGGFSQSTQVGSVFPYPLYVSVTDIAGDPLQGVVVNFSGPGVQLSSATATTDATGAASVSAIATAMGTNIVTASITGTSLTTSFALTGTAPVGLQFIPITPCRVVDTRNAAGTYGGPELAAGTTREFNIPQSACHSAYGAFAYSLNVTVVPNGKLDYLSLWPSGEPQPNVSTLNSDGRIKANAAIVPAGVNGGVDVFVSDATQVIIDIDGYFVPTAYSVGLAFYPLTPCRIADTRQTTGPLGGPFIAGTTSRDFPIQSSSCGLPSTAQAYSLNVTAVPHTHLDYLTTWPSGEAQPNVSTLNASTGAISANAAIVPAGSNGDVSIFVSNDADVILDVNGYFAPPNTGGLSLYTTTPCRTLDTRVAQGAFNGTLVVPIEAGSCAPPSTAQAYVLNSTVVPPAELIYLSLWPDQEAKPYVSTLNALDGAVTSNMAIVPTTNGSIDAFSSNATQLILDISSYFAP